tara:strand:+ start:649 stop:954 length:306 start_codon:yes stop_codon:yes gene_type:complete
MGAAAVQIQRILAAMRAGCDPQTSSPYKRYTTQGPHHAWLVRLFRETIMAQQQDAAASTQSYDPRTLAKKHRISVEDAQKIIAEHGADRKAADKAARRIAA